MNRRFKEITEKKKLRASKDNSQIIQMEENWASIYKKI